MASDRPVSWVELDGASNVRDVAGLPAMTGTTRPHILLRSDALDALTASDVSRLVDDIGLRHVVDLRASRERAERGRGLLGGAGLTYSECAVVEDADLERRRASRALAVAAGDDPESIMAVGYRELLDRGRWAFKDVLLRLVDEDGVPALVHCAAGKDRTGVLIALLLDAAGVDRAAIVADYVATNERMAPIMTRLRSSTAYQAIADDLPAFVLEARAGTMERFLEGLDATWGGAGGYFEAAGVSRSDLDAWRSLLVSPARPDQPER